MIFISHSAKDIELVNSLNTFLLSLGLTQNDIFCSSINGQGVKTGKRISDTIQNKLRESNILIFVITQNFIKSPYCTNELGAGWILSNEKDVYIFKSDDVENDEMKGFVNSEYKYSTFNSEGLSDLSDKICELYDFKIKHSIINNAIKTFLENAKIQNAVLVEDKSKSSKQLKDEQIKNLEKQYDTLSYGAKRIIAEIYFSYEGIRYFNLSNGIIGSLEGKLFVHRTTSVSTGFQSFAFELQPWVISFINREKKVQQELKELLENKNAVVSHEPGHIEW